MRSRNNLAPLGFEDTILARRLEELQYPIAAWTLAGETMTDVGGFRRDVPPWVPWLVCLAIVTGIGLCIYAVVQGSFEKPASYVLILFLVLFSLSTLTGILFVTDAKFNATTTNYALMVSGPAAIWLGGTLVMLLVPDIRKALFEPPNAPTISQMIQALEDNSADAQKKLHWASYEDWRIQNGVFKTNVVYDERGLLSELLEAAFTAPNPHRAESQTPHSELLRSPHISSEFLYFPKLIVKFQAVTGQVEKGQDHADVFFANRATDGSKPKQVLFIASKGNDSNTPGEIINVVTSLEKEALGWYHVDPDASGSIRYLLVNRYGDDNASASEREDRVLVDLKRYTKETGTIDLAILNYERKIAAQTFMWQMRGTVGGPANQVPLVFRSFDAGSLSKSFAHQADKADKCDDARYAAGVQKTLSVWLSMIDDYMQEKDANQAVRSFLVELRNDMVKSMRDDLKYSVAEPATFSSLLQVLPPNGITPKGISAFHWENASDVALVLVKPDQKC
jgi:hypothetical protein